MSQDTMFNFARGQKVRIGGGIIAVIEEIILARNMSAPFYLVEYWHEGHLIGRRMHEADLQEVVDGPLPTRITFIPNHGERR